MIFTKADFEDTNTINHALLIPSSKVRNLGELMALEEAARQAGFKKVKTCKVGFYCFEPAGHNHGVDNKYRIAKL
jgi:heme oxygenase